jgi:hypothetical protein
MKRRDLQLPPLGSLNAYLLRSSLFGVKNKESKYSTCMEKGKENIVDHVFY